MALIKELRGITPKFGSDCFLAENASVIGDVVMGNACSVWYQAVIRGDVNSIRMGNRVNVQDLAMIHCTFEQAATEIGNNVSIGHGAIVHGCTIHDDVLIGMGAIVMDRCVVESNTIIAAGAILTEGSIAKSGWIYAGIPARPLKALSEALKSGQITRIAQNYVKYSEWYKK